MVSELTKTDYKILKALSSTDKPLWGHEVGQASKVWPGNLYPHLYTLEKNGLVIGEWEKEPDPNRKGRRRYYHLTYAGVLVVKQLS